MYHYRDSLGTYCSTNPPYLVTSISRQLSTSAIYKTQTCCKHESEHHIGHISSCSLSPPKKKKAMFATRSLRQAAAHAERTPLIKFIGPRTIPCELFPFLALQESKSLFDSRLAEFRNSILTCFCCNSLYRPYAQASSRLPHRTTTRVLRRFRQPLVGISTPLLQLIP